MGLNDEKLKAWWVWLVSPGALYRPPWTVR